MPEFLEQRIAGGISYGSSYADEYAVTITATAAGAEYRQLIHPYPIRRFRLIFREHLDAMWADVCNLYHRAYGRYAGFRAKAYDDFTTAADGRSAPTATDHLLSKISDGVYQLRKFYGTDAAGLAIGRPARVIRKPVAGTVLIAVGGVSMAGFQWSLDSTTGRVTFVANSSLAVTGISKAASAVITFGSAHPFIITQAVHVSGVVGMTQINNQRLTITGTTTNTITVNVDSTGYSTYSSGGTVNTRPQESESVTGGCEFDIPVRFNSELSVNQFAPTIRMLEDIELIELLNP